MRTATIVFLTIALANMVPVAVADSPKSAFTVQELLRQPLPIMPRPDVVVITVDYAPGASTPPHEHPGATYAYVLKGAVVSQLGDEPHTYTEGQMWSETPHQHHVVSRNASATEPARLLVFMIAPHGEALTTMLPSKP
jgi:quercetin dioxygenase-like cupin family protein